MQHVNLDSSGNEYRIYSSVPGCPCPWCQSQRAEARRDYAFTPAKIDTTAEEAGKLLDQYAAMLMRTDDKKSYSIAIREAMNAYPQVAELYTGVTPTSFQPDDKEVLAAENLLPEKSGNELHDIALALQKIRGGSYYDALVEAVRENPRLAGEWNKISANLKTRARMST